MVELPVLDQSFEYSSHIGETDIPIPLEELIGGDWIIPALHLAV